VTEKAIEVGRQVQVDNKKPRAAPILFKQSAHGAAAGIVP
jgi:hypothetical protein